MTKYRKFIVAVIGAILSGLAVFFGIDLEAAGVTPDAIMAILIPILTAIGVWAVPNEE